MVWQLPPLTYFQKCSMILVVFKDDWPWPILRPTTSSYSTPWLPHFYTHLLFTAQNLRALRHGCIIIGGQGIQSIPNFDPLDHPSTNWGSRTQTWSTLKRFWLPSEWRNVTRGLLKDCCNRHPKSGPRKGWFAVMWVRYNRVVVWGVVSNEGGQQWGWSIMGWSIIGWLIIGLVNNEDAS